MFNWFKNDKPKLTITEEDKKWVEDNLLWLGKTYGIERIINKPFVFSTYEEFPYKSLWKDEEYAACFEKLCKIFEVNPNEIISYRFNTDLATWEEIIVRLEGKNTKKKSDRFKIYLGKDDYETTERTIASVAVHLAHHKLDSTGHYDASTFDIEGLVGLTTIFYGMGIFLANANFYKNNLLCPLGEPLIAYTNALLCIVSQTSYESVAKHLNNNTKKDFKLNYLYLQQTGNTAIDRATVNESLQIKKLYDAIEKAEDAKDYEALEICFEEFIKIKDDDDWAWSKLGYSRLMQGKFDEAIQDFNKAAVLNPYGPFTFDCRAFCRLQLGFIHEALSDITSAFNLGNKEVNAYRTVGVYHFMQQEYKDAIENLELALKENEDIDFIHFYLAKVYAAVGNSEKQQYHYQLSIEKKETNEAFLKANKI